MANSSSISYGVEEVIINPDTSSNEEKPNQTRKKYACFVTGAPPTELIKKYGDYGDMLINFLKEEEKNEEWLRFDIRKDEFPTEIQLQEISGIVITGSAADAHSDELWVVKLRNLCNQLYTKKSHKMMGFCFGHQLLGIAIGGKSDRAKSGWEIGMKTLQFNSEMRNKFPAVYETCFGNGKNWKEEDLKSNENYKNFELNVHEFHQDQVYELPQNATLLASSKGCPIEMFEAQNVVLGIQGHPEFSKEYHEALIRASSKPELQTVFQTALEEVTTKKNNNKVFQTFMREWLKND